MTAFQYRATGKNGQVVSGEIDASNRKEAQRTLEERGLTAVEVWLTSSAEAPPPEQLNPNEALQWTEHVARIAAARQSPVAGFRAAAEDSTSPRVAATLNQIALQLEQGKTLENILQVTSAGLPRSVRGLVLAAARTGNLAAALGDLVEHQRAAKSLRRTILDSLAYPIVVTGVSAVVLLLVLYFAGGAFQKLYADFQLPQPLPTQLLFWCRDVGLWLAGTAMIASIVAALVYRRMQGEAAWMRLLSGVPLFGPLSSWQGYAEWSSLMSVLIKYGVSLPEALLLSSAGAAHPGMRELSRELAADVTQGRSLSQVMSLSRRVPGAVLPLVRWGETRGSLGDAFEMIHEMFAKRVQIRTAMLQAVVPPMLFIGIGCCVLMVVGGLFLPVGSLLQALS